MSVGRSERCSGFPHTQPPVTTSPVLTLRNNCKSYNRIKKNHTVLYACLSLLWPARCFTNICKLPCSYSKSLSAGFRAGWIKEKDGGRDSSHHLADPLYPFSALLTTCCWEELKSTGSFSVKAVFLAQYLKFLSEKQLRSHLHWQLEIDLQIIHEQGLDNPH